MTALVSELAAPRISEAPIRVKSWAWVQPIVRDAQARVHRLLVVLERDWRNMREFRTQHPDTDRVLLACLAAVVLGILIARL